MQETPPERINAGLLRMRFMEEFFNKIDIKLIVLYPNITNEACDERAAQGFQLFYRPSSKIASYDQILQALGASEHWTLTDDMARAKIGWEPATEGYWFWTETAEICPRKSKAQENIISEVTLLSLEEYIIAWYAHKAAVGASFDLSTRCFLRTKYGSGALYARGSENGVLVGNNKSYELTLRLLNSGGRAMELFKR